MGPAEERIRGSAAVPGQLNKRSRSLLSSGLPWETESFAECQQQTSLIPSGFDVSIKCSTDQHGSTPASIVDTSLCIEIEVTEHETADVIYQRHDLTNNDDAINVGAVIAFQEQVEGGWASRGYVSTRGEHQNIPLYPGLYRLMISGVIFDNSYQTIARALDYRCQITFSNYVITPGAFQSHPILPEVVINTADRPTNRFTGGRSNAWYDPPVADGFSFTGTNDTTFNKIVALPQGFNTTFHIHVDGEKVGEVAGGESFDFVEKLGHAVAAFQVRNILPFVDPSSPTAFPIMLEFTQEAGSFDMSPLDAAFATVKPLAGGDLQVEFQGMLQRNTGLGESGWLELNPQPPSPLIIPKAQLQQKEFFRVRRP